MQLWLLTITMLMPRSCVARSWAKHNGPVVVIGENACGRGPWHSRPIVQVTSGDFVLTHDLTPVIPYFYATYTGCDARGG